MGVRGGGVFFVDVGICINASAFGVSVDDPFHSFGNVSGYIGFVVFTNDFECVESDES